MTLFRTDEFEHLEATIDIMTKQCLANPVRIGRHTYFLQEV